MSDAFNKLARPIQKWIRSKGWSELRNVQVEAIESVYGSDDDLIISASTAAGKTEAVFLPLLSQVVEEPAKVGFDILCISPLKALITDQAMRLEEICQYCDELPVYPWHGDVSSAIKKRAKREPKGVLIITPESLESIFVNFGGKIPGYFANTRAFVVDELHTLFDSERGVQIRSLMSRIEFAIRRPIRRIGISATIGDIWLAKRYLRDDRPEEVSHIEDSGSSAELLLQLRGYRIRPSAQRSLSTNDLISAKGQISKHIFDNTRGKSNLVFAGSRTLVERCGVGLRDRCEVENFPQEYFVHHASISKDDRRFLERRLKDGKLPTTAICTSTLELGIDIGDVSCVAQIGAPYSVASTRQRLGRSGRRQGVPSILRQYNMEFALNPNLSVSDLLRLGLVRTVAMIELLLENWCEPPRAGRLHLSTFVHQVLSVISERGGAKEELIFRILCQHGPFKQVSRELFSYVLSAMRDEELIERIEGGDFSFGRVGEALVEHYEFYAVFEFTREFRLLVGSQELGKIPVDTMLVPGETILFSGRRWLVIEIDYEARVVLVSPARSGAPRVSVGFGPGFIHDRVIEKMYEILRQNETPNYLDDTAQDLLGEARNNYADLKFGPGWIARIDRETYLLATHRGTVGTFTLASSLISAGFTVTSHVGFLEVGLVKDLDALSEELKKIAEGGEVDLFSGQPKAKLIFEKFHKYLTVELLRTDALSSKLDPSALPGICARILEGN